MFQRLQHQLAEMIRWLEASEDERVHLHNYHLAKRQFEAARRELLQTHADCCDHVHHEEPANCGSDSFNVSTGWSYRAPHDAVVRVDRGYEGIESQRRDKARAVGALLDFLRWWLRKYGRLVPSVDWEWQELTRGLPRLPIDGYYEKLVVGP